MGDGSLSQDEIDAILDKISDRGYESLTKDEKEKLSAHSTLLEEEIKKRTTQMDGARLEAMCAASA